MKKSYPLIALVALFALCAAGCHRDAERARRLAAAEIAFSDLSAAQGVGKAFVTYLRDDAVVFRPEAVTARPLYAQRPDRPGVRLTWQPVVAEVAAADDMGFTAGPWLQTVEREERRSRSHGHYVTVWRKEADGPWRVALDLGISHDSLDTPQPALQLLWHARSLPDAAGREKALQALRDADSLFMALSDQQSWQRALERYGSGDLRLLREGMGPVAGREEAIAALADSGKAGGRTGAAVISAAADLGYTYGEMATLTAPPQRFSYVRWWRRAQDDAWQVALEITLPFPAEQK